MFGEGLLVGGHGEFNEPALILGVDDPSDSSIAAEADPNLVTGNRSTSPLGTAALNGNYDAVRVLLQHRARLSDHELKASLHDECRSDGYEAIARLIESVR